MHIHLKKNNNNIYVYKTLEDFTMLMTVETRQSCEKGLLMFFLMYGLFYVFYMLLLLYFYYCFCFLMFRQYCL